MEILEAYCEELRRVIDIYEAQEEYFALPPEKRRRFVFRCSDSICREEKKPLIVAVNYDKDAEETEKYRQPHFKTHDSHPHHTDCFWVTRDKAAKVAENENGTRTERPKATNVIDVFSPKDADTPVSDSNKPAATRNEGVKNDAHEASDQKSPERNGFNSTSLLERFVDCWSQLEEEDLRRHFVLIDGQNLSYRQACLHIHSITPGENGQRILWGGAHINLWPRANPTHLYVNFIDGCDRFAEVNGGRSLTIELPLSRLEQSRRGPLLRERARRGQQEGFYVRVYAWGVVVPNATRPGYRLDIASLDNLVLKAIESKSGKNGTPAEE